MSRLCVQHPSQIQPADPLESSASVHRSAYPVSCTAHQNIAYSPMNVSNDERSGLALRPAPNYGFGEQLPPISSLFRDFTVSDVHDPSVYPSVALTYQQPYARNPAEVYTRCHPSSFTHTIDAYSLPPPPYDGEFDPTIAHTSNFGYSKNPYSASGRTSNNGRSNIDHSYSHHTSSERSSAEFEKPQHSQSPSSTSPPPAGNESPKESQDGGATISSQKVEDGKVKKHVCACGKAFSTSGHLSRHERTHTNIKPFACPIPNCTSRFSRHDNMRQHFRSHQRKLEIQREQRRRLEEWQRIQDGGKDIIEDTLLTQSIAAQRQPAMAQPSSSHRNSARQTGHYSMYNRSHYAIPTNMQMQPARGHRPPAHSAGY